MELKRNSKRPLGVLALVSINVIAIDSLRNIPTNAENGLVILAFYLLATLLFFIPCILITAELATHYPKTGGAYVWVREAFGQRWGFVAIWLQWIYNVFWYPTILSFIATNIAYLFDPGLAHDKTFMISMVIGMFLIATTLNCLGMKVSGLVSIISAVGGTIAPMAAIIILGGLWIYLGHPLALSLTTQSWLPKPSTIPNLAFFVIILFSLVGMEMSAVHAESVNNPKRDYPKALFISGAIIVVSLILSSLAVAIVVPHTQLSLISGLDEAFNIFLSAFHLKQLMPLAILLIILGGFGGMAAWVIGPTKGIVVAAEDGSLPRWLAYRNQHSAPLAVLVLQAVMVIIICGLFLLFKSINTTYWILSDLTAQLALIFYVLLFSAAIRLHSRLPKTAKTFRIPGKRWGAWFVGGIGLICCIISIGVSFIPPSDVAIANVKVYETILVLGIVIFTVLPLIIDSCVRKKTPAK